MTLDLAQFHETFFEESFEALGSMEAALLKLSAGEADAELINTIFRVAHSIKGGSATFGFADVAAFTHTLETLLDQLRSGQRQVQSNIVDGLLRSVDVLRDMLTATQRKQPSDPALTAGLNAELQAIMKTPAGAIGGADDGRVIAGWRIGLVPGPLMMEHGNDPLRMMRELATLGTLVTRVDAGKVLTLAELDPEVCLLSWQMELRTDAERSAVEQIFEWAEGECTLSIEPLSPVAATHGGPSAATAAAAAKVAATAAAASGPVAAAAPTPNLRPKLCDPVPAKAARFASVLKRSMSCSIRWASWSSRSRYAVNWPPCSKAVRPMSCATLWCSSSGICARCRKVSCACACCRLHRYSIAFHA